MTTEAEQFIADHVTALLARDLDRAMADYDDASVFRMGGQVLTGADAIGAHIRGQMANTTGPINMDREIATAPDGRVVMHWNLRAEPGGPAVMSGVDYFAVANGVITDQEVLHEDH